MPPHPGPPTYYNIRTIHHIAVTTVLRSWSWANDCPKHVELIQRSIKLLLLHLVGHLYYSPTLMMHGPTQIKSKDHLCRDGGYNPREKKSMHMWPLTFKWWFPSSSSSKILKNQNEQQRMLSLLTLIIQNLPDTYSPTHISLEIFTNTHAVNIHVQENMHVLNCKVIWHRTSY